ncbi:jg22933 [Pararge aegeria aegeria]|uniref:Jg22933 protein n=1 Tax=Pararge aegeria aegeria TaxID=348720 RepID=A0A8S4R5L6_9NEOP|nr:jg22933 [Pararge aegeria aegeria]
MYGTLARTSILGRSVMRNFIRNGSHGGVPGENMPIGLKSRAWITWNFFWYTATGFGAPFVLLALQMKKK